MPFGEVTAAVQSLFAPAAAAGIPTLAGTTLPSPTVVGPAGPNFFCFTGVVNLFRFIRAPGPRDIIGTLTTLTGATISIIQSNPLLVSGPPLSSVEGRLATVCGNLVVVRGQVVLDVRTVIPPAGGLFDGLGQLNPFQLLLLQLLLQGGI